MIIIISLIIILILLFCIFTLNKTINELQDKLDSDKYNNTVNRNRICMVEYYMRNYKEGENPFTVLRDISNVLKMENEEVVGYEEKH